MIKIFLDMDGVVADFETSFERIYGKSLNDIPFSEVRKFLDTSDDVFSDAPMLPGARELFDALLKIDPNLVFLSSIPYENFRSGYQQKVFWLRTVLGANPDRLRPVFEPIGKAGMALSKTHVLIDDYDKHIDKWNEAGATGILYTQQPLQKIITQIEALK